MRGWLLAVGPEPRSAREGNDERSDLPELVAPVFDIEFVRVDDGRVVVPGEEGDDDEGGTNEEFEGAEVASLCQNVHGRASASKLLHPRRPRGRADQAGESLASERLLCRRA